MTVGALSPVFLARTGLPGAGEAAPVGPAASGPVASFAAALGNLAGDAVGALKGAEAMSVQALQGKADAREVVDAVMGAEQALQTAVAIRDKIVAAYLEVSRMAI